jgi:hypothetical protein
VGGEGAYQLVLEVGSRDVRVEFLEDRLAEARVDENGDLLALLGTELRDLLPVATVEEGLDVPLQLGMIVGGKAVVLVLVHCRTRWQARTSARVERGACAPGGLERDVRSGAARAARFGSWVAERERTQLVGAAEADDPLQQVVVAVRVGGALQEIVQPRPCKELGALRRVPPRAGEPLDVGEGYGIETETPLTRLHRRARADDSRRPAARGTQWLRRIGQRFHLLAHRDHRALELACEVLLLGLVVLTFLAEDLLQAFFRQHCLRWHAPWRPKLSVASSLASSGASCHGASEAGGVWHRGGQERSRARRGIALVVPTRVACARAAGPWVTSADPSWGGRWRNFFYF